MARSTAKVGVIGCGAISSTYFETSKMFDILEIVACADMAQDRAIAQAEKFGIPKACSVDELLADPEIEIVLNLTVPMAHHPIAMAALDAGKSVYNEKPLSVTREEGRTLLEKAAAKGLRVGCAPDTFMGAGLQTCRKAIDDGLIGTPVAATAFMMYHGPENFHPDPGFFYKAGGGPMFDMGPYYITAMVNMLGPVGNVTGSAKITFPERTIATGPKAATKIPVEIPTHVVGILDFRSHVVATLTTSFDVWTSNAPIIEIYGSEGTLSVPDPNAFGGPVRVKRVGEEEWREIPLANGYTEQSRSIGLADMAVSIRSGRKHRANDEMAYHVLDIMHAVHDSAREGRRVELKSTCERPSPLPIGLQPGELGD
jgi:predicted dehydrogenase